ncbi:uncharacterized protein LOC121370140 [Gigantopelta aegis]|uniref:uncharacterized protein LOC121370140 n=1 Tax=Gigantopelta aegis TaxID=1735272 RepID=UPI001B88A626|nr:uncharacterized protein LOC121370140 [Gigantopelta aegis]
MIPQRLVKVMYLLLLTAGSSECSNDSTTPALTMLPTVDTDPPQANVAPITDYPDNVASMTDATTSSVLKTVDPPDNAVFMRRLILDHRRYCGRPGVCLHRWPDRCYRCEPCQCDDFCSLYDDCCPDILSRQSNISIGDNHRLPRECVSAISRMYGDRIENVTARAVAVRRYFMVTSCQNDEMSQLCADSPTLPPVTSVADNVTFLNKYCAACNNVTQYRPWAVKIDCTEKLNVSIYRTALQLLTASLNDDTCAVYHHPPNGVTARECFYDDSVISKCNVTGMWPAYDAFTERACGTFTTVKLLDGRRYRNPFCFICNAESYRKLFPKCKRKFDGGPVAFSALLDFGDIFHPGNTDPTTQCDEDKIYDAEKDRCRVVTCSPGKQLIRMQCEASFGISKGLGYEFYFGMESDDVIPLTDDKDFLHLLPSNLVDFISVTWFKSQVTFHDFTLVYNTTGENGTCSQATQHLGLHARLTIVRQVDQMQFERKLLSLKHLNFTFAINDRVFSFRTYPDSEARYVGLNGRGKYSERSSCVISVSIGHRQSDTDTVDVQTKDVYFIRVSNLLDCPQIDLDLDEYSLHDTNSTLSLQWLNHTLEEDDYETNGDGTIKICLKYFKPEGYISKGIPVREDSDAVIIVSMVCTVLSLSCLLVSFMTFCIFKPLRQIPGQNNMNLCFTLFSGQLLYLVGSGQTSIKGVCEAMGIFIHYFWLAAFCSMGICSFHMFRVFTSMRNRDDSSDRKRKFLQYCIFVYGMPVVIVVATLVIHLIISEGRTIGYGGRVCYLSSAAAVGLAFGVPVAATVVVNAVFFFMTIRSIRISPKLAKNKQDEEHILVYVKLSTLTGITWITGFIAIGTQIPALEYIFIIINASQGLFLFFSFVCNRRIYKMFMDCCRGTNSRGRGRSGNYVNSDSNSRTKSTTFTITSSTLSE